MNVIEGVENICERLMRKKPARRVYPLLLLLLVIIGFLPLWCFSGVPAGHDLYYHMSRLNSLALGLKSGAWTVPISADLLGGYGYASGLFYPDLWLYPAALLAAGGIPLVVAYKLFLMLWGVWIAFGAYYAGLRIGKTPFAGFACGLLYSWSSYLAVVVLIRAALGEYLAFAFFPWVILGCYEILYGKCRRFYYLGFGLAGIVLSHNLSLVIVAIAMIFWFGLNVVRLLREPRRIAAVAGAGVMALALSLYYLAPLAEQLMKTRFIVHSIAGGSSSIADHAVPFTRLFLELPYMKMAFWIPSGIGLILMIAAAQRLRFRSQGESADCWRDNLLLTGLFGLLCATSFLPWEGAMRALSILQFPWRTYLLATAALALGGGLTLAAWTDGRLKRERRWLWILLLGCGSAWWLNTAYIYAAKVHEGNMFTRLVPGAKQEASGLAYLPAATRPEQFAERGDAVTARGALTALDFSRPRFGVVHVAYKGNHQATPVELPLVYYLGYTAVADESGAVLPLRPGASQLVEVVLPENQADGGFTVRYTGTRLARLARWISLGSWLAALLLWLAIRRTEREKKNARQPRSRRARRPRRQNVNQAPVSSGDLTQP